MLRNRGIRRVVLLVVAVLLWAVHAVSTVPVSAQNYPNRPIELIVSYDAGGTVDLTARILAKHAEKYLGQRIIVVNRPGGGGSVGFTAGAFARPDGYTLTMGATPLVQHKYLLPGVPYDYSSFEPVFMVTFDPNMLVVRPGSLADMPVPDLIQYARDNPRQILMGVGGHWASHDIARAALELETGAQFQKVVLSGGAGVVAALLGDHVHAGFNYIGEFGAHLATGSLKVLAVAAEERSPFVPDVPTFRELGFDVVMGVWRAVLAPKGTPQSVIQTLYEAFMKTAQDPEFIAEMERAQIPLVIRGPEELRRIMEEDDVKYRLIAERLQAEGLDD